MYSKFVELLQSRNVTVYQVSKATGIAQSVFSSWKSGISTPRLDKIEKIADYFGVTTDYLLGRTTDCSPGIKGNPASDDESPRSGVDERVMSLLDQMTEDQKRQWIDLLESFLREKGIDPDTHRE